MQMVKKMRDPRDSTVGKALAFLMVNLNSVLDIAYCSPKSCQERSLSPECSKKPLAYLTVTPLPPGKTVFDQDVAQMVEHRSGLDVYHISLHAFSRKTPIKNKMKRTSCPDKKRHSESCEKNLYLPHIGLLHIQATCMCWAHLSLLNPSKRLRDHTWAQESSSFRKPWTLDWRSVVSISGERLIPDVPLLENQVLLSPIFMETRSAAQKTDWSLLILQLISGSS